MTDDPNERASAAGDPAGGDPTEPVEIDAADMDIAEAAPDLDDTQLESAAEAAEDTVEAAEADQVDVEPLEDVEAVAAPAPAPGVTRVEPAGRPGPRVRGPKPARTAFAIDPALRIRDLASAAFVIITLLVFAGILANAMLLGTGGALRPIATPSPVPSVVASPSAAPSASPVVSPSPAATPTPAASPSTAPTVVPSTAPSPGAS